MARVCAVASSKGGVGKTTTTANLSATLAAAGYDVAVVDGDIGMANLGDQLGVTPAGATLHDVLASGANVEAACYEGPHGMTVVPGGTELDAFSEADITRLGRVVGSFADRDFVFVDTGAGLSHETALPVGLADEVVLVSTADRDSLKDTEKTRLLAERLGADVAGAVLTRVTPGDTPGDASPLSAPVLGSVPEDTALHAASTQAVPVTDFDAESPAAAAYRSIAGNVADGTAHRAEPEESDPAFAADAEQTVVESAMTDGNGAAPETDPRQVAQGGERTQNRRETQAEQTRGTPQGQDDGAAAGAETAATEAEVAGSWEDSPAWSEQSAEELQKAGSTDDIPSAEAGVEIESGRSQEEVAFEDSPQTAPLEEEGEAEESSGNSGFLSRLFS